MNDLSSSIKKIMIVFLMLFVALITYLIYFFVMQGPEVVNSTYNKRLWAKRNEILRGTIYDRDMKVLSSSTRNSDETQTRNYEGGKIFAHSLGYVNTKYGLSGLENKYDSELMADDSSDLTSIFDIFKQDGTKEKEKVGHSLKVTLDYEVQKAAYDLLGDRKGAVVAINPQTGEILAMVSKPAYDPNDLEKIWDDIRNDDNRPLLNRAVSGLYPPGSVFKVVTAVSALENISGVEDRKFTDNGKIVFNDNYSLSNYGGNSYGKINLNTAFLKSSNVVFGTLAMELGNDKLKATAEKFLFNQDIIGEGVVIDNSRFPTIAKTEQGNIAQSGIGQSSILATPMEMALVTSAIANDGVMMSPKLVNEVLSYDGQSIRKIEDKTAATVTTKQVAATVQDYMKDVVQKGTGTAAAVQGITVAGKTGTADHDDKAGVEDEPHSWFVGFAPYENPTIALAVIVEEGGTGGGAAAKVASGVFKAALK